MHISEQYRSEQQRLHSVGNYGVTGAQYAPIVSEIVNRLEVLHLLDYGCGSNLSLAKALKVRHKLTYQAYDPGVEKYASDPVPAQMVACVDVLEHVEPEYLDSVLDHLKALTEGVIFVSIHTGPAVKVLSDGRNAHLTQQPLEWWLPKLWARFDLHTVQVTSEFGFYVVAYAKPGAIEDTSGERLS